MATIEQATTQTDFGEATVLLQEYISWVREATGFDPLVEQPSFAAELPDLDQHYGGERGSLYLARIDDAAVGTATVLWAADASAELKRMYVTPAARGGGVASQLVEHVVTEAEARGCPVLWLESLRGVMGAAISLYRRHGFVEVADRPRTAMVEGLIVMERDLTRCRVGSCALLAPANPHG